MKIINAPTYMSDIYVILYSGKIEEGRLKMETMEEKKTEKEITLKYQVFTDDNFHFMDESERSSDGTFDTFDDAVSRAIELVDKSLRWERWQCENQNNPDELYDRYMDFGDDPFVRPCPEGANFSAWEYAKTRCKEICEEPPMENFSKGG